MKYDDNENKSRYEEVDHELLKILDEPFKTSLQATIDESQETGDRLMTMLDFPFCELSQDNADLFTILQALNGIRVRVSPCGKHIFVQDFDGKNVGDYFVGLNASIPLGELIDDIEDILLESLEDED